MSLYNEIPQFISQYNKKSGWTDVYLDKARMLYTTTPRKMNGYLVAAEVNEWDSETGDFWAGARLCYERKKDKSYSRHPLLHLYDSVFQVFLDTERDNVVEARVAGPGSYNSPEHGFQEGLVGWAYYPLLRWLTYSFSNKVMYATLPFTNGDETIPANGTRISWLGEDNNYYEPLDKSVLFASYFGVTSERTGSRMKQNEVWRIEASANPEALEVDLYEVDWQASVCSLPLIKLLTARHPGGNFWCEDLSAELNKLQDRLWRSD